MRSGNERFWLLSIPLWFGRLNIKRDRDSVFSERYAHLSGVPTFVVGPLRVTWRRYRTIAGA